MKTLVSVLNWLRNCRRGITMMPLDKDNKPIHFEEPKDEEEEDKDKQG